MEITIFFLGTANREAIYSELRSLSPAAYRDQRRRRIIQSRREEARTCPSRVGVGFFNGVEDWLYLVADSCIVLPEGTRCVAHLNSETNIALSNLENRIAHIHVEGDPENRQGFRTINLEIENLITISSEAHFTGVGIPGSGYRAEGALELLQTS